MLNDMKQKLTAYTRNVNKIVGILALVIFGGAIFLSTETGRNLTGININPLKDFASQGKFRKSAKPIAGQYIVVLKSDVSNIDAQAAELNGKHLGQIKHIYTSAVSGFAAKMTEADALAMSEEPNVEYVEEDGVVTEAATQSDPYWALDRIDQRAMPYDLTYNYTATGRGVNIYIIDTGILTTHTGFGGRAFTGTSTASGSYDMTSCNGHGTGVAGIAGGSISGVAKDARLYSIRVFPCSGYAALSDVIAGVDWVTRSAVRPAVANMSLGTPLSSTLNSAVAKSIQAGITYAVASGNDSADACSYSPGAVSGAITTGAAGSNSGDGNNDVEKNWSNYGRCVDILSPGQGVFTLWNGSTTQTTFFSGTSAASPYTAGVAALYLETHPSASPAEVSNALTQSATSGVLALLHPDTPNRLLYSLVSTGTPPPPSTDTTSPSVSITSPRPNTTIRNKDTKFSVSASDASGIATIVIQVDGNIIKTCYDLTSCNGIITASALSQGIHSLSATATDKAASPNTATTTIQISKN